MSSKLIKVKKYILENDIPELDLPTEYSDSSIDTTRSEKKIKSSWYRFLEVFNWYPAHYSKFERYHIFKLDIAVTLFCGLSFFTKYLDQMNLTNAYVAGYIQTGAYHSLNGRNGLTGWRWQFIIDGLITAVVVIYGITLFPGSPNFVKKFGILTQDDLVFARKRLKENHIKQSKSWDKSTIKKIIWSWEFILLPFLWILHHQVGYSPAFSVWLKAEKYSVSQRNNLPTATSAISCISMLVTPALCDIYGKWLVSGVIFILTYFYVIVLLVWDVSKNLKFTAFYLSGLWSGLAPAFYAWAAIICKDSAEKKVIILALMNSYSSATLAWTVPIQWNTKYSPKFTIGWSITIGYVAITQLLFIVIWFLARKEHKSDLTFDDKSSISSTDSDSNSIREGSHTDFEKNGNLVTVKVLD
ncbi:hypothetical protein WICMUC_005790 [Wickerhamomyces mucosus]|uniref:Uncharacterized protein n=1 Tax=Wickerhamomyces mucosus TaxID=1378264 RepID=A0A9P8P3I8_9ASCO|nr:hypothetical protein WICMUC_005790 [Wickerhamomyces mucosus]